MTNLKEWKLYSICSQNMWNYMRKSVAERHLENPEKLED
jgi:hypothetical protein